MISPTDIRLINLMIEKCGRLIDICNTYDDKTIESNYVYSDAIQYEFEKLYEEDEFLGAAVEDAGTRIAQMVDYCERGFWD